MRLILKENTENSPIVLNNFVTEVTPSKNQSNKIINAVKNFIHYPDRKLGEWLVGSPGYSFSPFSGFYHIFVRKPSEWFTQKILNRKLEPAFFLKLPLLISLSVFANSAIDQAYELELRRHIDSVIVSEKNYYDSVLNYDYRFHRIYSAVKKGKISLFEGEREAYFLLALYDDYYKNHATGSLDSESELDFKLLDSYLYSHLKNVIDKGVDKDYRNSGYDVPNEVLGPLNENQIRALFKENHQTQLKYQIISSMTHGGKEWEGIQSNPEMAEIINNLFADPFTQSIIKFKENNKISAEQMQYLLQEDIYWQNYFQNCKILGIHKYKIIHGQIQNEYQTLEDTRSETLMLLKNSN